MGSPSEPWDVARAVHAYNIASWGAGYFGVNDAGNMTVRPVQDQGPALDLMSVMNEARERNLTFPLLLRFQDLLRHRVQVLNEEFRAAIGNRAARLRLTQEILRAFEPIIRQYPSQWFHFVPVWTEEKLQNPKSKIQ